eukprot:scaffold12961_cov145-Skeletonema_marinoi.AAC.14
MRPRQKYVRRKSSWAPPSASSSSASTFNKTNNNQRTATGIGSLEAVDCHIHSVVVLSWSVSVKQWSA